METSSTGTRGMATFLRDPSQESGENPTCCSASVGPPPYLNAVQEFLSSSTLNQNNNTGNFDFDGLDLSSEVPLGEILEKLSSSSSSVSSIDEDDNQKNKSRRNNVIELHADREGNTGTTISATVNVATLDLSDPESIHRHLSQLNDTVLKVTTSNIAQTPPPKFISTPVSRRTSSGGGKSSPQTCGICSKVFSNASALAKHRLTHSEERRYHCSICGKAFKRQDHLNGHLLTHRSTKPFACNAEGCGKSYCDARSLRRHKENHHPQSIDNSSSNTNNNLLDSIKFSGKGLTPQQFQLIEQIIKETKEGAATAAAIAASSNSQSVSSKLSVLPVVQQPVECAICGRKFKNIPALNGHMRLHGGYYKKDSEGRRIPSLTEAALLQQQQSMTEKSSIKTENCSKSLQAISTFEPKTKKSKVPAPSLAFRSLPPPDTTKLLENLERKALQQQQTAISLPLVQQNQCGVKPKKRRKKNNKSLQFDSVPCSLPTAPLPPAVKPPNFSILKVNSNIDKTPKIGLDRQAVIPEKLEYVKSDEEEFFDDEEDEYDDDENDYEVDRLLWNPIFDVSEEEEDLMTSFLEFAKSAALPKGYRGGPEFALYALMRRRGDIQAATRDLLLDVKAKTRGDNWSEEEINKFYEGLAKRGKDFPSISGVIGTKTSFQCVEFYYSWKNLCRKEFQSFKHIFRNNNSSTLINGSTSTIGNSVEAADERQVPSSSTSLHQHNPLLALF